MNRFTGLAIINLALAVFAQVTTHWTKSRNLSTSQLELFYEAWILPVKSWSFSYMFGLLYAIATVYLLYKVAKQSDVNLQVFNSILAQEEPTADKNKDITKESVGTVTQLKSYCGSTGTISIKEVEHLPAEEPEKGEVFLQSSQKELTNPYLNFYEDSDNSQDLNKDVEGVFLSLIKLGGPKYVYEEQESAHDSQGDLVNPYLLYEQP